MDWLCDVELDLDVIIENLDLGIDFLRENKKGYDLILIITLFLLIF